MSEYFLGLDVGSTASKCVVVDSRGAIATKSLFNSGAGTVGPQHVVDEAMAALGLASVDEFAGSCATGYGRHLYDWTDREMSELSCHAIGSHALCPSARTIIDIGGQDAKVLSLDENGMLKTFVMNDKCAAGTGRFLDVMAHIFGVDIAELSGLDTESSQVAAISSTCTVFAESEVISKLAAGTPIADVAAGVHASVVDRTAGLVHRNGVVPDVFMSGGVAQNDRLRERLADALGVGIMTDPISQYVGALGAALSALSRA